MQRATAEKGLENRPGQNNCFLNVCIQALWHLESFRAKFLSSGSHVHKGSSCIYCALKVLFTQYQFSPETVLPPTALRSCLSILYKEEDRFRMGALDDAAEALEAILTSLNKVYLVTGNTETDETDPNSLSNKVFGCPILERIQCRKCQAVSQPQGSDLFIYYTYATEIRSGAKRFPQLPFDRLLKALSEEERKSCPNEEKGQCKEKKCPVYKYLLQQPEVFTIGLVWVSPNPSAEEIVDTLSLVSRKIRLSNIFEGVPAQFTYRLKGMICYYGLHYDCYFYNSLRKRWLVFDDTIVKEVGASWDQLIDRCRRGRFHPSVLFYERVEKGVTPLPSNVPNVKPTTTTTSTATTTTTTTSPSTGPASNNNMVRPPVPSPHMVPMMPHPMQRYMMPMAHPRMVHPAYSFPHQMGMPVMMPSHPGAMQPTNIPAASPQQFTNSESPSSRPLSEGKGKEKKKKDKDKKKKKKKTKKTKGEESRVEATTMPEAQVTTRQGVNEKATTSGLQNGTEEGNERKSEAEDTRKLYPGVSALTPQVGDAEPQRQQPQANQPSSNIERGTQPPMPAAGAASVAGGREAPSPVQPPQQQSLDTPPGTVVFRPPFQRELLSQQAEQQDQPVAQLPMPSFTHTPPQQSTIPSPSSDPLPQVIAYPKGPEAETLPSEETVSPAEESQYYRAYLQQQHQSRQPVASPDYYIHAPSPGVPQRVSDWREEPKASVAASGPEATQEPSPPPAVREHSLPAPHVHSEPEISPQHYPTASAYAPAPEPEPVTVPVPVQQVKRESLISFDDEEEQDLLLEDLSFHGLDLDGMGFFGGAPSAPSFVSDMPEVPPPYQLPSVGEAYPPSYDSGIPAYNHVNTSQPAVVSEPHVPRWQSPDSIPTWRPSTDHSVSPAVAPAVQFDWPQAPTTQPHSFDTTDWRSAGAAAPHWSSPYVVAGQQDPVPNYAYPYQPDSSAYSHLHHYQPPSPSSSTTSSYVSPQLPRAPSSVGEVKSSGLYSFDSLRDTTTPPSSFSSTKSLVREFVSDKDDEEDDRYDTNALRKSTPARSEFSNLNSLLGLASTPPAPKVVPPKPKSSFANLNNLLGSSYT